MSVTSAARGRQRIFSSNGVDWSRIFMGLRPWLYLAPVIILFVYFKFIPLVRAVEFSFQDVGLMRGNEWIGLENYRSVLGNPAFYNAAGNTIIYAFLVVILSAVLGFMIALLLQGQARITRVVRAIYFIPVVIAVAVAAQIWSSLLWPTSASIVNQILGVVGLGPYGFFSDPNMSLGSVIAMHTWKLIPYNSVIFVAALAAVDRELYDVADIDGANGWQKTIYVTLPSITGATYIVLILSVIRVLRTFQEVYLTTGGGPAGSSHVIMTHIYRYGFDLYDYGYAAASSVLLIAVTITATIVIRNFRDRTR